MDALLDIIARDGLDHDAWLDVLRQGAGVDRPGMTSKSSIWSPTRA